MSGRTTAPRVDESEAVATLLRLLAVEGITGREKTIGEKIARMLVELGIAETSIRFDDAHRRIPLPTEAGNLIVDIEGDAALPRRLFMAHRDVVPLVAGVQPVRRGERIVPKTETALGGDDRAGVGCLLSMLASLKRAGVTHPPLTLLFTVREESGLHGARHLDPAMLRQPRMAFNLDGASPQKLTIGAVGGAVWSARIRGQAAHSGLHPERGVSAILVAANALTALQRRGWWGRIRRPSGEGTSNAGLMSGPGDGPVGSATNIVTDFARVEGEARSHDARFIRKIVAAHRRAFESAATKLPNDEGRTASVEFESEIAYLPFRLDPDSELVRFARRRSREIGLETSLRIANGGLDANWMVRHGIDTLTFGVGQRNIHTKDEYVDIPDYLDACRLAIALAMP